ncbi:MAG: Grx4 family monothiol glutaredoxin [Sulfuricella sp.]|nr:Grx4 family monothiol glutaredoxin [Sulfuricella sp.]
MEILDQIRQTLHENAIVLYMKGTPTFPQCGFSGKAVQVLRACGLTDKDFLAVNVLMDPAINEGIRQYASWPTFPQLYLKGELIGGSDIMTELFEKGDLQKHIAEVQG